VKFRLNIDVRKRKGRLMAECNKNKICFHKRPTEFEQQEYSSSQCSPYEISFLDTLAEE